MTGNSVLRGGHPLSIPKNQHLLGTGRDALAVDAALGPGQDLRRCPIAMGAGARQMTSLDAARARLDHALARLTEGVAASSTQAARQAEVVERSTHEALLRDHAALRQERDAFAARLEAAEQRMADLAHTADELGRRLNDAILRVERLMEG